MAPQPTPSEPREGTPGEALTLFSFAKRADSVLSSTPFAGKVEMALRMAGIEFEGRKGDLFNKAHAPKRKMPTLLHGKDTVTDSGCIMKYLQNTYPDKFSMFQPANAKSAALALSLERMLEGDFYFCMLYCHWQLDDVFNAQSQDLFAAIPGLMRGFVARAARKDVISHLYGQGLGRHSKEFICERMDEELKICNDLLVESGAFLTGSTACLADLFLFSSIEVSLNGFPKDTDVVFPVAEAIQKHKELLAFHKRLRTQYFPDGTTPHWEAQPASGS